jgi:hypothetical protein
VLDLVGVFFGRLIVPEPGRFMFQHSGHALRSLEIFCTAICAVITGFRQYAQCSACNAVRAMQCSQSRAALQRVAFIA